MRSARGLLLRTLPNQEQFTIDAHGRSSTVAAKRDDSALLDRGTDYGAGDYGAAAYTSERRGAAPAIIGAVLGLGLLLGCSGEDAVSWTPPTSPSGDTSTAGTADGANTSTAGGMGGGGMSGTATSAPATNTAGPIMDKAGNVLPPQFNYNGAPFYLTAVQLSNEQYARSVQDILKLPAPPSQANSFLNAVGGFTTFTNNERVLEVSNDMREAYQLAAKEIADDVGTAANISRIGAGTSKDTFIATLGRRAFRRPLTQEEVSRYAEVYDKGAALSGTESEFTKGAKLVVEALIQSPYFLYRTELGAVGEPLSSYEIAAKLSFWLRGTTPSDELLDDAEAGAFDTANGVAALTQQLLEEQTAKSVMTEMHAQLLKFTRFNEILKTTDEYDPAINDELMQASRMFFDRIFDEDLGLRDILTSTKGYVGPKMAKLYGLPTPTGNTFQLQELGPERPGYFSQVPYLAAFGDNTHSDAIHRGLFINFEVLCASLPAPTGDVALPPAPKAGQSDRERMEAHTGKGTCGEACHGNYINPLGYAFENFDGLGRLRTQDADRPVDTVSSYPFADGLKTFDGPAELMNIIADSAEAHACYAKNLMSFALQRDIVTADKPMVESLAQVSKTGSLKSMILELVKSPAFRLRNTGSTP
jgi:hypothetical protein